MILSFSLRSFRWFVRKIGPLNLIYFVLYLLAIISFCCGLISIVLYLQADRTVASALCCVLVGWMLARSRLPTWKACLLAAGFSIAWLVLVIGRLYIPLGPVLSALGRLAGQAASVLVLVLSRRRLAVASIDFRELMQSWDVLRAGLVALMDRLGGWFTATRTGATLLDPLVTNLVWDAAVCLVSSWGAWFIRRRGAVIVGLLPTAALLTYLLYYTNAASGMIWLIPLGGLMVVLQAAEGYQSAWERWLAERMDRIELEAGLAAVVIGLAAVLMVAGWILPSISIREIQRDIRQFIQARQNERLPSSLGLRQYPGSVYREGGALVLPPMLRITAGPHLPQDVVMDITIAGYHPPMAGVPIGMAGQQPPPTYYFRGQTYDLYTGFGWTAYPTSEVDYPADYSLLSPSSEAASSTYRLVRQYVQRSGDQGGPLFVSGELISADQSFQVTWRGQGDQITARTDALSYWANSRQILPSINRLRSAGTDYPSAVRARYLQLPSDLPERVRSLALDLTAAQPTPYDAAVAIETYLRKLPYTLDVPAPPLSSDAVDYFLFDLKKGYCDYYATAMTVLARAAGIPARLVIGYSTNLFDSDRGQFVVTAADAHSCV